MAFLPRRTSRGEAAFLAGGCAAPFSGFLLLNVSAINRPLTKSSFEGFGNSAQICTNYTVKPREKQPDQNKYNEAARGLRAQEIQPVLICELIRGCWHQQGKLLK